jgi:hypothetical protein
MWPVHLTGREAFFLSISRVLGKVPRRRLAGRSYRFASSIRGLLFRPGMLPLYPLYRLKEDGNF